MKINNMHLSYSVNDTIKKISLNFLEKVENDDLKLTPIISETSNGYTLEVKITNKKPITLNKFIIDYSAQLKNKNMMVNGYQSCTESMEMSLKDDLKPFNAIGTGGIEYSGDYYFYKYQGKKGVLHSHTFTYFRDSKLSNNEILFIGSLDEKSGYTIFEGNLKENKVIIFKDCEGYLIDGEKSILNIYMEQGDETQVWDKYSTLLEKRKINNGITTGWTSYCNSYNNITQDIMLETIETIRKENIPLDIFEVDDGYEKAVGDWLLTNEKFPLGMNFLAYKIKSFGYKSAIWIAPFICEKNSEIFKNHKDWIVKDNKGKNVVAGYNRKWGGKFYALDFYNIQVRQYLAKVFHTVINIWGYEMLKLDFLYAVAIVPRKGKTRAGIMNDALEFLRDIIGDKLILASGVPLGSAFNKVDYCRVGTDILPYWENNKQKFLRYRERNSAIASLHSILSRYRLNNRMFYNDSNIFLLRDENNKLNDEQKNTLFILNNILGELVFFSDDISKYDKNSLNLLKSIFPKRKIKVDYLKNKKENYQISFYIDDREYIALTNLSSSESKIKIPEGEYFNKNDFIVKGNTTCVLKPYETKYYYKIKKKSDFYLIGTTGHLFSGSEIDSIEEKEGNININISDKYINKGDIFLKVLKQDMDILVNGEKCSKFNKEGYIVLTI